MLTLIAGLLALAAAHYWMERRESKGIDAAEEMLRADQALYALDPDFAVEMGYQPPPAVSPADRWAMMGMDGSAFAADAARQEMPYNVAMRSARQAAGLLARQAQAQQQAAESRLQALLRVEQQQRPLSGLLGVFGGALGRGVLPGAIGGTALGLLNGPKRRPQ